MFILIMQFEATVGGRVTKTQMRWKGRKMWLVKYRDGKEGGAGMNPVTPRLPIIHTDGLGMMIIYQSGEYMQLISRCFF